jgi:hypothetical protein
MVRSACSLLGYKTSCYFTAPLDPLSGTRDSHSPSYLNSDHQIDFVSCDDEELWNSLHITGSEDNK